MVKINSNLDLKSTILKGTITKIYENKIVIKRGIFQTIVYTDDTSIFSLGQKVTLEGKFSQEISKEYYLYLRSKFIDSVFYMDNVKETEKTKSIYYMKNIILNYYENNMNGLSYKYFKALVLCEYLDSDMEENISGLGISYLFSISGFHVALLSSILEKIIIRIDKKNRYTNKIIIVILFLYTLFSSFSYGLFRAFLMYLSKKINDKYALEYTKLDILSETYIFMMIINPLSIYSKGFKLTFITTLFILISSNIIKGNMIKKSYMICLLCFFSTLPIVISINYEINFLTIIVSPIFSFLLSYIIMPIMYLLVLIPKVSILTDSIFQAFTFSVSKLNNLDVLKFNCKNLNDYMTILYYSAFIFVLYQTDNGKHIKKSLIAFFLLLFIIINPDIFANDYSVTFIDVKQGDSCLISNGKNKILIDSYNNLDYLKEQGIKKIDAIMISHSDKDHIQTCKDVLKLYNAEILMCSYYDEGTALKEVIPLFKKVYYLKSDDKIKISSITFNILGPVKKHNTANNCSVVTTFKIKNTSFMFTGDMEKEEEEDIISKYNYLKFDILKVAHHGSTTSSTNYFLNNTTFKVAVVSVAKVNSYNLPDLDVINKLKAKADVYITKDNGSVKIKIKEDSFKVILNKDKKSLKDIINNKLFKSKENAII